MLKLKSSESRKNGNNWRVLALSIIEVAMKDYANAISEKKFSELSGIEIKEEKLIKYNRTIAECEEFFSSDYIKILSDIPGKDFRNMAYRNGSVSAKRKYKTYCKKHHLSKNEAA